jgi:hypothetical protein
MVEKIESDLSLAKPVEDDKPLEEPATPGDGLSNGAARENNAAAPAGDAWSRGTTSANRPAVPPPPSTPDEENLLGAAAHLSDEDGPPLESEAYGDFGASGDVAFGDGAPPVTEINLGRCVEIEVKPAPNWQETCRQVLALITSHPGDDALRLKLSGQPMILEFPNHRTGYTPQLVEAAMKIAGVARVGVGNFGGANSNG